MKNMMRICCVLLAIAVALVGMPILPAMSAIAEDPGLLTLPAALTVVEEEAFAGATSIVVVVVPEGTTAIKARAFADSSLKGIVLPESLTSIASDAFEGCADGLIVEAPEGSYAYNWALEMGYIEETPDTPASDFVYTIANGEATITGYNGEGGAVVVPATIEGAQVTSIARNAFAWKPYITSISLPEGLTYIGMFAFSGCDGLTEVTIPASVNDINGYAFNDISSITEFKVAEGNEYYTAIDGVLYTAAGKLLFYPAAKEGDTYTLPDSATGIGWYSFENSSLVEINIPDSVTSITDTSFSRAEKLERINANDAIYIDYSSEDGVLFYNFRTELVRYPEGKKGDSYTIPDSVTEINTDAFNGNAYLKSITIPGKVTNIYSTAFAYCTALETVVVSEGVEDIGYAAFAGCESLKSITLPESLTEIDEDIFEGCNADMVIYAPADSYAYTFFEESGFTVAIPDDSGESGGSGESGDSGETGEESDPADFSYSVYNGEATVNRYVGQGGAVVIPAELGGAPVTAIGNEAFSDKVSVTSVVIPEGVTTIGSYAFGWCYNLTSITLPSTLTQIKSSAFMDTGISSITIPAAAKVGDGVFKYCSNLTEIIVEEGNANCKFENGVLLSADGATLLCYPCGRTDSAFTVPDGVTGIATEAFAGANLESITLPASVTSIADYAFDNCEGLAAINVSSGNTAFKSVDGVLYSADGTTLKFYPAYKTDESFDVPSSVTAIGNSAFAYNRYLRTVVIPENVTSIGTGAFFYCSELEEVVLPNNLTTLGNNVFSGCSSLQSVNLPTSLTAIPNSAFEGTALTSIEIPESVTSIGAYAFYYGNLTELTIPGTVESIGRSAFYGCFDLTTVTVSEGVKTIDAYAFAYCHDLYQIILPASLTGMGGWVLDNCSDDLVVIVTENSFAHTWAVDNGYTVSFEIPAPETPAEYFTYTKNYNSVTINGYTGPDTEISIPRYIEGAAVTTINYGAFQYNRTITSVKLPSTVTQIGGSAFSYCSNLAKVDLNEGLTYIDYSAFNGTALTEATLPASLEYLANDAFYNCSKLTAINVAEGNTTFKSVDGVLLTADGTGIIAYPHAKTYTAYAIPDGVTTVSTSIFTAPALQYIEIPASVTNIYSRAFVSCSNLAAFSVDAANANYKSVDGVLLSKDGTTLLTFPPAKAAATYAIPDGVTTVESYAFAVAANVKKITIPASVTTLKDYAISSCFVEEIELPATITSYGKNVLSSCYNLTSVTLPEGMTTIPESMFRSCYGLTGVQFPSTVTAIGPSAFRSCSGLTSFTVPEGVTTIGDYAFYSCSDLTSLVLPESVTSIGSSALENCNKLVVGVIENSYAHTWATENGCKIELIVGEGEETPAANFTYTVSNSQVTISAYNGSQSSIIIPAYIEDCPVVALADYAMVNNTTLKNITLPETMTTIGYRTLAGSALETINIPAAVTAIGLYAFVECENLKHIDVDDANTVYSDIDGVLFSGKTLRLFPMAKEVDEYVVPDGTTRIDYPGTEGAKFTKITLPASITDVGTYGLHNNPNLTEIVVAEGNGSYVSVDGVLFNRSMTQLVDYPIGNARTAYTVPDTVTSLEYFAFYNAANLESVTLPEGLTDLGTNGFYGCASLKSIELPDSVNDVGDYAFAYCTALESVKLSAGLNDLGLNMFYHCESLKSIDIPETVTSISERALSGCKSLTEIIVPEGVTYIDRNAFSDCTSLTRLVLPSTLTSMYYDALDNVDKTALTIEVIENSYAHTWAVDNGYTVKFYVPIGDIDFTYTIENGEATITGYTGKGGDVVVPATIDSVSVTAIGEKAFYSNKTITSVTLPDSVTSIGASAFRSCTKLTEFHFPANLKEIGEYAFRSCGFTTIDLPDSLTATGDRTFWGCSDLVSVTLPSNLTVVSPYTFYNCTALTAITLPDTVTEIGELAFRNCGFTTIDLPAGLTTIDDSAFAYSRLTEVTIPAGVTSIHRSSFTSCSALTAINVEEGNANFKSVDGVLFSEGGSKLMTFPCANTDQAFYSIPEGTTAIDWYAFRDSCVLTVHIPASVSSISECAFTFASYLYKITVDEDNPCYKVENDVLYAIRNGYLVAWSHPEGHTGENITIADGTEMIMSCAFQDTDTIKSISFPDTLTFIHASAFEGSDGLTSVTIPGGTGTTNRPADAVGVGVYAFASCTGLTTVVLEEGCDTIRGYAFQDCTALTSVTLPASMSSISATAFEGCSADLVIYTIEGSYAYEVCAEMGWNVVASENNTPDAPGDEDENVFTYTIADGEATITGYNGEATEIIIPETIEDTPVTTIGDAAFMDDYQLKKVVLPSTLTTICEDAFYCSVIESITVPASVTSIGDYAFHSCAYLAEIAVEEGNANYKSVDGVLYGEDGTRLMCCPGAWNKGALIIPEGVTVIDSYACREADMTAVTVPASLTNFDSAAFDGCTSLAAFTVADGSESYCAVDGVIYSKNMEWLLSYPAGSDVTEFTVPAGVTRIAEYAFSNSDNLESVTIPDGVTNIGLCAFEESDNLKSVTMTDSVTYMDWQVFANCPNLESIRLSENITEIGGWCFLSCYSLKKIDLPDSLVSIGNYAFGYCEGLTEVVIPEGVESIGNGAFIDCLALTRVTLPESLTGISDDMLPENEGMTVVVVEGSKAHIWANAMGYTVELAGDVG